MIDADLKQRLNQLLSRYGRVENMQCFPHGTEGTSIILATMESPKEAASAQHALGLTLFGFNSLIINETWLHKHLPG